MNSLLGSNQIFECMKAAEKRQNGAFSSSGLGSSSGSNSSSASSTSNRLNSESSRNPIMWSNFANNHMLKSTHEAA